MAMQTASAEPAAPRRGRPPGTSARELELISLRLFSSDGFEETTVEHIAAEAGVSRRTFFRYFESKADVLWHAFDGEVGALRAAFGAVPPEVPLMQAIRDVVVGVNSYRAEDVPELRTRMHLIGTVPALQASAAQHYDAWERAVSEFASGRLGCGQLALPAGDRPGHSRGLPVGLRALGRARRCRSHGLPGRGADRPGSRFRPCQPVRPGPAGPLAEHGADWPDEHGRDAVGTVGG